VGIDYLFIDYCRAWSVGCNGFIIVGRFNSRLAVSFLACSIFPYPQILAYASPPFFCPFPIPLLSPSPPFLPKLIEFPE